MKVYAKDFNVAIANVSKSVSKDEYRPVFQKIHLVGINDGIIVESCDGFRLHRTTMYVIDNVDKSFDILVDKLDKIPKGIKEVTIKFEDNKLVINDKPYDFEENFKGKYLDTDSVFPTRNEDYCILLNARYLKDALQHLEYFNSAKERDFVELRFEKDAKTSGIDALKPIVLSCGIGCNMVLPVRPNWK